MHDTPRPHTTTTRGSTFPTSAATSRAAADAPRGRSRRELRFWAYLAAAGSCALLIALAAFVATPRTDDGPSRAVLAWLIAVFMGLAVYFSTAATDAAHRLRSRQRQP
jgi:uncharacterized membrane protein YhaH (DUF805 family)